MYKEITYLSCIGCLSYFYNLYIYPIIITSVNIVIYNNFIISLLLLIHIDNVLLFNELNHKKLNNNDNEDKYINIILNQINNINKHATELKYKYKYKSKSCNDLNKIY